MPPNEADAWTAELDRLLRPGLLGFYTSFEVTELFAFDRASGRVSNVLTVAVAEDRGPEPPIAPHMLTPQQVELRQLPGWTFGVQRYTVPTADLVAAAASAQRDSIWRLAGDPLAFGQLLAVPDRFVPPDGQMEVAMNAILKNNFWNGSHVIELFDVDKIALRPLLDPPSHLQELTEHVNRTWPIGLAAVSDRLGNVLIQLPVTVLMASFQPAPDNDGLTVEVAWHPQAAERPLRATCESMFDGVIERYASAPVLHSKTPLPLPNAREPHQGTLWDEDNHIVLSATGASSFLNVAHLSAHFTDTEPRTFELDTAGGGNRSYRLSLFSVMRTQTIGQRASIAGERWTDERIYRAVNARLESELRFKQYRPDADRAAAHEAALDDLRILIDRFAERGAWLWDPYLSARDVLETLYFCQFTGADLRALTDGELPSHNTPVAPTATSRTDAFIDEQRADLRRAACNNRGLRLQYRIRRDLPWPFHDRFLIFPRPAGPALAWSLGTSVNSVGTAHHILQQIDDGQLIADAFLDLWDRLAAPECQIWSVP